MKRRPSIKKLQREREQRERHESKRRGGRSRKATVHVVERA